MTNVKGFAGVCEIDGYAEYLANLQSMFDIVDAALQPALEAAAAVAVDEIQSRTRFPNSIHAVPGGYSATGYSIEIGYDAARWWLGFEETGTAPHELTPRTVQALKLHGSDTEAIVASAQLPGVPARPFLRPGFDAAGPAMERAFAAEFERRLARLGADE